MKRILITFAIALAVAVPSYALAQVESTPIPAPHKPNFSSMEFLVGTWACSTKSARRPSAYITTSTYTMDSTGYWLELTSTTNATSWIAKKLTTYDKITYDPDTHRWVDVLYGDGGAYGLSFSSGWMGNKMSWHDVSFAPGPDVASQTDNVVTKVSPTKMTSASSFTETKTGRKVAVTGVCTKH
ncbi:MAG: hypothetical protein JO003_08745 [Candidatus Eremiobacteraeota bacterium]|nr:hypothetical protein [Candidatus Eremiobacteraeota bacterium]